MRLSGWRPRLVLGGFGGMGCPVGLTPPPYAIFGGPRWCLGVSTCAPALGFTCSRLVCLGPFLEQAAITDPPNFGHARDSVRVKVRVKLNYERELASMDTNFDRHAGRRADFRCVSKQN